MSLAHASVGAGFWKNPWIPGCDTAELVENGDGFLIQKGGPPVNNQECKTGIMFAMPYEVGFVVNFTVGEENIPRGCGILDGDWRFMRGKPDYPGSGIEEQLASRVYPGAPSYQG